MKEIQIQKREFKLVTLKDVQNPLFWVLSFTLLICFNSIYPYLNMVENLLETKYCISSIMAGYLFEIPYVISAICSIFIGILVDKIGRRLNFILLGNLFVFLAFFISIATPVSCPATSYSEVLPLTLIGLSYAIFGSTLWSAISFTVEPHATGTAYGITHCFLNIGRVIFPTVSGIINEQTKQVEGGYFYETLFWIFISMISFVTTLILQFLDRRGTQKVCINN